MGGHDEHSEAIISMFCFFLPEQDDEATIVEANSISLPLLEVGMQVHTFKQPNGSNKENFERLEMDKEQIHNMRLKTFEVLAICTNLEKKIACYST